MALGALAIALGLYWFIRGAGPLRAAFGGIPWDFEIDWNLARAFLDGFNPYTPEGAKRAHLDKMPSQLGHPPSTAFWALPFVSLDLHTATFALGLLCITLVAVQMFVTMREIAAPMPAILAWLGFTFVISASFFPYHVSVGQISAWIGFCFFLSWLGIRRDDDRLAGIALGAAFSLKLFAGVAAVHFFARRRYRVLAFAAGVFAFIAALMASRMGWSAWPLFFEKQKAHADQWLPSLQNLSLHGIVSHLFLRTCEPRGPVVREAMMISSALSGLLIGATYWLASQLPRSRDDDELSFGTFVLVAMFTSQWAWEHYNVILVVPFAILVSRVARARIWETSPGGTLAAASAFAAFLYSMRIPRELKDLAQHAVRAGDRTRHLELHVYEALNSAPLVILLTMALTLLVLRVRETRAQRSA